MTTDARRAELAKLAAQFPHATGQLLALMLKVDAEAEARGIAKGLEMAVDELKFMSCGCCEMVRALSQSTTKGQG